MSDDLTVPRTVAVHGDGIAEALSSEEHIRLTGVSGAASAAFDIMADDRVPAETAWNMALTAGRQGKDPEAFARHFVKLRRAYRKIAATARP